jgi:Mrp family chromosome partitioning ATPase
MSIVDQAFIKAFASPGLQTATGTKTESLRTRVPATATSRETSLAHDRVAEPLDGPHGLDAPGSSPALARGSKGDEAFRAFLEIDRAAWPEACGELLDRAGRDWDRFTEQLIERMGQGEKCIALAGSAHGDGNTTISLALARHVAARGLRPLVVDADPENPELARSCGVSVQTGWDDVVVSGLSAGEALIMAVEDGVTLLPWRGRDVSMAELAANERVGEVFGTLREHYDLVLLDAMPLVARAMIADFAALAGAIRLDAVYLIHNVRTMSREQLSALCAKIRESGLPLAGVIENFVPPAPTGPARSREFHSAAGPRGLATS